MSLIAELEQRLRVIERSAGGMPWQEDLRLVTFDLRAAIGNVERRLEAAEIGVASKELVEALEAVSARIETLESASTTAELAAVRQELEEQKTRPATVAGLDEIRAAIGRLEERPDRADEISQLAQEISVLTTRLDQLTDVEALQGKLETIAGQTEAAQAGFAGLERRLDELAGLESRLDAVADRVPDASLLDELALRVDEAVASSTGVDTVGLTARIDALEQDGRAGSTALERLTAELGELGGRTQEQLAELASLGPDASMLDELRTRVDELAGRVVEPDLAPVEELRARVEELALVVGRAPDASLLEELRARVDELAGRVVEPDRAPLEDLRAPLDELRARLDELAGRVVELGSGAGGGVAGAR